MKAKRILSFLFFLYYMYMAAFFSSCQRTEVLCGYIPIGEKLQVSWPDPHGGPVRTIKVVTTSGDTMNCITYQQVPGGGWNVIYRDTYPKIRNKKVFVLIRKKGINSDYEVFRVVDEEWYNLELKVGKRS